MPAGHFAPSHAVVAAIVCAFVVGTTIILPSAFSVPFAESSGLAASEISFSERIPVISLRYLSMTLHR